ncbi:MAG: Phasin (PHA-granule associated protein) [Burkholderiales bacterium PBB5]|nr:MAG: Phasin (PHA-granule associated protein) [Burkholderiales bacterium PBB5]
MNQPTEQFLNAAHTTLGELNSLAATGLAGFEKLVELNLATAKDAMADTAEQMQAALSAKAPQDLAATASLLQPMAEKAAAYGRAVAAIVTDTGAALTKSAESQMAQVQAQAMATIDATMKHAPAGSEGAVAAFKSAVSAGQHALETAQANAKAAASAVEKNLAAVTDAATKATRAATKA